MCVCGVFFQAEDGIRDLVRSRGLGDVYKRQACWDATLCVDDTTDAFLRELATREGRTLRAQGDGCLLYTSDAADERSSVDLGGRRIIKKKNNAQDICSSHL